MSGTGNDCMLAGSAISTGKVDESFLHIVAIIRCPSGFSDHRSMVFFLFRYNRKKHPEPEAVRETALAGNSLDRDPTNTRLIEFYSVG